MSIVVVATITPKPDQRDAVFAAIMHSVPAIHDEDGCELYAVHDAGEAVVIVEQWRDQAALDAHGVGAAVRQVQATINEKLLCSPSLVLATPLPAGIPILGRLVSA
jgi:quinol monooxygenase YgiN